MGEWMYRSTFSSTQHYMQVSGQLHAPAALPPGKRVPGTHWIGGWVGPRTAQDDAEKRKVKTVIRMIHFKLKFNVRVRTELGRIRHTQG
jgi:hypothetical protein